MSEKRQGRALSAAPGSGCKATERGTSSRGRGRPPKSDAPGLDRRHVLEAALRHVDAHGIESLGIRKLAGELGVAPNSLYSYVKDKDDMVQGVVELVLSELELPAPEGATWTERCLEVCRGFRVELLRHPNVVVAPAFRRTFPFGFLPMNYALGEIVADAGYEGNELVETMMMLFYHTVGFVTLEIARSTQGVPTKTDAFVLDRAEHDLGAADMDEARELLPFVRNLDMDALFDSSLSALLDGLAARRTAGAGPEPHRDKKGGGNS